MPGLVLGAGEPARSKAITTSPLGREENVSHQVDASSWVQGVVDKLYLCTKEKEPFPPGRHSPKFRSIAWKVEVGAGLQPHFPTLAKPGTLVH